MLLTIIAMLIVFSFLVIIHELGHYFAAKWQHIHVEEFGLGYPPRAKQLFSWWGTDFTLNWIPFGGFVKMEGEDGPPSELNSEVTTVKGQTGVPYYTKSALGRLIVILAGATVNLFFGVVAFAVVFSIMGIPRGATVSTVLPGSIAEQAGLTPGTVVTAIESQSKVITVVNASQLRPQLGELLGQQVTFVSQQVCDGEFCNARRHQLQLPSPESINLSDGKQPITGITPTDYVVFYPWYRQIPEGILFGFKQALMLSWTILSVLSDMVRDLFTRGSVPQGLAGPVGIAVEANQYHIFENWVSGLLFAGLISINLGVMNLLPIPALDGGRALFIVLESLIGRKNVNRIEGTMNQYSYLFLVGLMVLITARDIIRLITGG